MKRMLIIFFLFASLAASAQLSDSSRRWNFSRATISQPYFTIKNMPVTSVTDSAWYRATDGSFKYGMVSNGLSRVLTLDSASASHTMTLGASSATLASNPSLIHSTLNIFANGRNPLEIHTSFAQGIELYTHSNTGFRAPQLTMYRSRGDSVTPAAVQSTDALGGISFGGYDGSFYRSNGSFILATATQDWSTGNRGSDLSIWVTPNTTSTGAVSAYFNNNGKVSIIGTGTNLLAADSLLTVFGSAHLTGKLVVDNMDIDPGIWAVRWNSTTGKLTVVDTNSVSAGSGAWSPTLTADANVDGTPTALHATYTRQGNIVTCYVTVSVDPTLITTQTEVGIPLPIASNFTDSNDASGSGAGSVGNGAATFVQVNANTTSDRATLIFQSGSTSVSLITLSFRYTIQ